MDTASPQPIKGSNATPDFLKRQVKELTKQGRNLAKAEKFDEAFDKFESAMQLDDKDIAVLNSYANTLVKANKLDSAIQLFERSFRLNNTDIYTINNFASALFKYGESENAIQLFEYSLALDCNCIITLNRFANILAQSGNTERAIQLLEKSLQLDNENIPTFTSLGNLLAKNGDFERAIVIFKQSLQIEPNNIIALNSCANLLFQCGETEEAIQLFEESLKIEPNNIITLNSFANILAQNGRIEQAIQLLEKSLHLKDDNIPTLNSLASLLSQRGEIEQSIQLFERALRLDSQNNYILISFANLLAQSGEVEQAIQLFERSLEVEPNNVVVLNMYANLLAEEGEVEYAIQLFERALELDSANVRTLNSYGNLLIQEGKVERAIQIFETLSKIEPGNFITLNRYANLLVQKGEFECAINLFEKSLLIEPENIFILGGYANALIKKGDKDKAIDILARKLTVDDKDAIGFNIIANLLSQEGESDRAIQFLEKALELEPNNSILLNAYSYTRLQYAKQLEGQKKYEDAVLQLLEIPLAAQQPYHANIVRLHLGRLYYLLNQPDRGKQYIDEAIANSDDKDISRLYAARSLLAVNSSSDEAIQLLQQIEESSPRYNEAMKALALNADPQTAYELFAGGEEDFGNTEMLYRAIYHKIGNEVAILKSIAQRLLRSIETEHPIVREIIGDLEDLQESITRQRATEKATIATIPRDDYQKLIEVVAKTAHDIADEVNNILATIESKTRRVLRKLPETSALREKFEKLLAQLELTQTALNDLKSINEGMVIRRHRFPVRKLFEKWEPINWSNRPRLQKAKITLRLDNPDAEFDGDEEKIKSIINELVENSLKHNHDYRDLSIRMFSRDLLNPMDIGMPTMPGDRKYLYIQISDSGKGIPADKKEWIFQPLHTTSPEEKGSGLGLFIARKTLQKMGGYIRETGESGIGAKFQIYIPYLTEGEI